MKRIIITMSAVLIGMTSIYFFKGYSHMKCAINTPQDLINLFPKTVDEIATRATQCKEQIITTVNDIIALSSEEKNFDNTFGALDKLQQTITVTTSTLAALEYLSPDKGIRDCAHTTNIALSTYIVEHIATNKKLYRALLDYVDNNMIKEELSAEENFFVSNTMDDYKRIGLDLDEEKLGQVRSLMQEINALSAEFEKNINQDSSSILVTKEELQGLPAQTIDALEKKDNLFVIKTDYPTVFAILDHCTVQETRKKVFMLMNNRAYPQNVTILDEVINKRHQLAKTIGFKSYAALELDSQMAETPEVAQQFIMSIVEKAKEKAKKEIALFLKAVPEKNLLDEHGAIQPWNTRYIKNSYKEQTLVIDDKKIAEYFPLDFVVPQLLNIYETFFSITFKEIPSQGFWHTDVKLVQVFDKHEKLIAYIILDLFPRDNKFSHAAQLTIMPAINDGCPAAALVMANFPKPTKDKPALLRFDDVNTFFHEFGHALHAILGRTTLISQSGTNVPTDFVEMPSQMLENWLKDETIMKQISKHYLTGEPLPAELRKKLTTIEQFDAGDFTLRQLTFALMSLEYFNEKPEKNVAHIAKEIHAQLRDYIAWEENDHFYASFGHLMGYGAKYYGYMWAKVFSCDLFEKIKENGLLNPKIGQEYLETVIVPGGSKDPNDLLEAFLGRKPNPNAFFNVMGF